MSSTFEMKDMGIYMGCGPVASKRGPRGLAMGGDGKPVEDSHNTLRKSTTIPINFTYGVWSHEYEDGSVELMFADLSVEADSMDEAIEKMRAKIRDKTVSIPVGTGTLVFNEPLVSEQQIVDFFRRSSG